MKWRIFNALHRAQRFLVGEEKSQSRETLIGKRRMQESDLKEVETAKSNDRWESAYSGSSEMEIPNDFLMALSTNKNAETFFGTLNRTNLYWYIIDYIQRRNSKRGKTEWIRSSNILARSEKFH